MTFKLSANSMSKMTGIKNELHTIVCEAIRLTKIDFGVICGLRTQEEQDALLAKGATQTKTSKHMTGDAVDLMAYVGSRASWELNLYDDIADPVPDDIVGPVRFSCTPCAVMLQGFVQ